MAKKKKQHKQQFTKQESVKTQENQVFQEKLLAQVTPAKYRLRLERVWLVIGFILIGIGLFLVVNGISTIVNKPGNNADQLGITLEPSSNASIDDGASIVKKVKAQGLKADEKANMTTQIIKSTGRWQATDYVKGDIGPGSYTVKLGDTLWEIADAVYGSGFKWKKILAANSKNIGFLRDHSQALIIPGQVLIIPE